MNSVTKLIYITMAITWWQFSLVQAGGMLGELIDEEDTAYLALELKADSKRILFRSRDDQKQEGQLSDPSLKFLYFCPPQQDWHTEVNEKIKRSCLFLVEISNERETVRCKNKVVPSITLDNEQRCGFNDLGNKHSLHYLLFYHNTFLENVDWLSLDMKQYENLVKTFKQNALNDAHQYLTVITIYQFCFYHYSHETAFASYTISSLSSKQPEMPQNFDTRLTENDDQRLFGLDDAPSCYKKENQSFIGTNVGDDYLVEQMLVPWNAIGENIERGTTKNYVNISPQWESLRDNWNSLHQYFKSLPTQLVVCGTHGKFKDIHLGEAQFDEQQQQKMPHDQLHDSNTSKKPNLTLTVPVYWWKLIVFGENKGIALIVPNYPRGVPFPSDTIEPLCENVCAKYGWTEVKLLVPTIICCEPNVKLIARLMYLNSDDIPENISSLTIPQYKSPQLEFYV